MVLPRMTKHHTMEEQESYHSFNVSRKNNGELEMYVFLIESGPADEHRRPVANALS